MNPKYSIVIPTRNRLDTLEASIACCLALRGITDYEVVVFDNNSTTDVAGLVASFEDSRLKYFRSDVDLAMSGSWETAIGYATGTYINVLGDDDALLPHCLQVVDALIEETGTQVVSMEKAFYMWPGFENNTIQESLKYNPLDDKIDYSVLRSRFVARSVTHFYKYFTILPMLYNSFVHRAVLDAIRADGQRVFLCQSPDICGGFAILNHIDTYVRVNSTLGIWGISPKSNGANSAIKEGTRVQKSFIDLNAQSGYVTHADLPQVKAQYGVYIAVIDAYLHQSARATASQLDFKLDYTPFITRAISELFQVVTVEADLQTALAAWRTWATQFPTYAATVNDTIRSNTVDTQETTETLVKSAYNQQYLITLGSVYKASEYLYGLMSKKLSQELRIVKTTPIRLWGEVYSKTLLRTFGASFENRTISLIKAVTS